MSEERIVALWDTHIPFNIPLEGVYEFIKDFKPTKIILGGDIHDWTAASHWIANQGGTLDSGTIKENYEELKSTLFIPLSKAAPGVQIIFLTGNHEDWLAQAIALNPKQGQGYWELENNLDLKKYNMKIIPVNTTYEASPNLVYIHGLYTVENHAKKTVQTYHCSVFYGHTHDVQAHVLVSPINISHFYKGQSCGCLCNRSPHYMKNKPNRWVNGFNYAYVEKKTGLFWDTQVTIVEGKFWANGRKYK